MISVQSDSPVVSVIMPVYNAGAYLEDAIVSVLNQTYRQFEFIAIDDGSTDESTEILRRFISHGLIVERQTNSGYPSAMNRGLQRARGRLIARMDGDDVSAPDRLEQQVQFLEAHPEIPFVGSLFHYLTPHNRVVHSAPESSDESWSNISWNDVYAGQRRFADPSVVFRLNSAQAAGSYRTYQKSGQDVDLWLRILEREGNGAQINRRLYYLRISTESITGSPGTAAKARIPRILAEQRKAGGDDAVMRGESVDSLLDSAALNKGAFWFVWDCWNKAKLCLSAGDIRSATRFAIAGVLRGGAKIQTLKYVADFLRSIFCLIFPLKRGNV